jgi:uncharacterized protein
LVCLSFPVVAATTKSGAGQLFFLSVIWIEFAALARSWGIAMQLFLKQLETGGFSEEKSLNFAYALDLSDVRQFGQAPYPEPVRVTGSITARLGFLTIAYTAEFIRHDICARCLTPIQSQKSLSFSHMVMERALPEADEAADSDDDILYPASGVMDMDEIVIADMLLEQDTVVLCSPDCRGLCPACGVNRNERDCDCREDDEDEDAIDSRFAILRELLDDDQ